MKDKFEFKIAPDGTITTMYQDGIEQFAEAMGGDIKTSCRASNVEWEEIEYTDGVSKGWSIRSAYDANLAIRDLPGPEVRLVCSREQDIQVALFTTREAALEVEVKFFWELLAPKREERNVEQQHSKNDSGEG